jgi:hypothetical protein
MLHLDPLTRIQGRQKRRKMLTDLGIRCGRIRCLQSIIAAQEQFIASELQPAMQRRVSLKTLACRQSTVPDGSQTVLDTLDSTPAGMRLAPAAVQESEPRISEIHNIVRVVRNQYYPWPLWDVAVIRHVNEEFCELLGLNPVMKHGDELLQFHIRGIVKEQF